MRIFSKTHDYYDGVAGHDSDPKRVFNRPESSLIYNEKLECKNYIRNLDFFIVGFCGQIYPGLRFGVKNYFGDTDYKTVYDYDSLPKETIKNQYKYSNIYNEIDFNNDYFINWFNKKHKSFMGIIDFTHEYDYIFKKYHVPYFQVYEYGIKLYPSLKELEFYKVFDAYSCYQRIDSYLFNELVPPDVINYVPSDKLKAQAHGFDKFSFRKDKQKVNK